MKYDACIPKNTHRVYFDADIIQGMEQSPWITLFIVSITLIGIAIGRYPIIRSNRTTIALLGVALLVLTNQVPFEDIPTYFDFNTLILLFSMMVLNANLKFSGFFNLASKGLIRFAKTPRIFLAVEIVLVGVLSAFFLNDTVCLMFTPLLLSLMTRLKRNPIPYLIALATASNVGSVATLTGNPQNMIVGVASGIPYLQFTLALAPIALLGLGVIWLVLVKMYAFEFRQPFIAVTEEQQENQESKPVLLKTTLIIIGMLAAMLLGVPVALAAFIAANALLITRRYQPHLVFAEFDWSLLVFFAALFVISGSLETSGAITALVDLNQWAGQVQVWSLSLITGGLSNLVSNVPAVLLLRPLVVMMQNARIGWLTLAASSTLAGNLTLLGSVANLIVAESAARWRVDLSFWEYTKSGILITLITLGISIVWLTWMV
jgi:Na+/H+ antiporter NhaD/arsenite permease-like protein